MIKLIDKATGVEMWVHESMVEAVEAEKPAAEPEEKKPAPKRRATAKK